MAAECCMVLMMKSAARSKQRVAARIGERRGTELARRLIACAREDLAAWPGPVCLAPSTPDEVAALEPCAADTCVVQRGDNLGERINHVNDTLLERGFERQIFIGIDCPVLDTAYAERAAAALADRDVVFGPALDGGVVLMGVRGRWPDLAALPWSTDALFAALQTRCTDAGARAALLEPLRDVDWLEDLLALRQDLERDPRPARRALCQWLAAQTDLAIP